MRARMLLALCVLGPAAGAVEIGAEQTRFATLYPQIRTTRFEASSIPGLFQVTTSDALFYFAVEPGLLVFGEVFDPSGTSLTGARREALKLQRQRDAIPVEHPAPITDADGVSIKRCDVAMTAFLDVHCGYCAQAVQWLVTDNGIPDAALRVVFVSHNDADRVRAEHVLCAPPHLRAAALRQAFAGGKDTEWLRCESGPAEVLAHERIAAERGVSATPVFTVSGQTVLGFNRVRLESLVDQSGKLLKE